MDYAGATLAKMPSCDAQYREPSVSERLASQRETLEAQLARVIEAQRLLESQPGVAEVLNALSKLGVR